MTAVFRNKGNMDSVNHREYDIQVESCKPRNTLVVGKPPETKLT